MFGPGVPLYLSFFYPRERVGFRHGVFLSGAAMANAYGGALAYGISQIRGSVAPWRILFIIEGVPTCLFAIPVWFLIPDSITKAKFLTEREKEIALHMTARNQRVDVEKQEGVRVKEMWEGIRDPKSWIPALCYFGWLVYVASWVVNGNTANSSTPATYPSPLSPSSYRPSSPKWALSLASNPKASQLRHTSSASSLSFSSAGCPTSSRCAGPSAPWQPLWRASGSSSTPQLILLARDTSASSCRWRFSRLWLCFWRGWRTSTRRRVSGRVGIRFWRRWDSVVRCLGQMFSLRVKSRFTGRECGSRLRFVCWWQCSVWY